MEMGLLFVGTGSLSNQSLHVHNHIHVCDLLGEFLEEHDRRKLRKMTKVPDEYMNSTILLYPLGKGRPYITSYSDVTSRGRPTLGPYESFPDVILRPVVRRT